MSCAVRGRRYATANASSALSGRVSSDAAMFARRCVTDDVPGISSMLGARRSSQAIATCAVVALQSRATSERVEDWSAANPPSGKNGT